MLIAGIPEVLLKIVNFSGSIFSYAYILQVQGYIIIQYKGTGCMHIYPKQSLHTSLSKRVYLVDNNPDNIAVTRRSFAMEGYSVHLEVFQTVDALVCLFNDDHHFDYPDLILIDSHLPNNGRFKLIAWIRHHPDLLLTPVVIVGHGHSHSDVVRSYELGASSYIQRSADFTEYSIQLKGVCSYWLDLNVLPASKQFSKSA